MIILRTVYYFGKNYFGYSSSIWNTYLPPILSGIISFLIAYFIFWKGKKQEIKKEEERLNELEEYFFAFFESLNKVIEEQVVNFVDFSHLLRDQKDQDYILGSKSSLKNKRILAFDEKDLFKIFVNRKIGDAKKKNKHLRNHQDQIDLITEIYKESKDNFKTFNNKMDLYQMGWNESLKRLSEIYDKIYNDTIKINPDLNEETDKFFTTYCKLSKKVSDKKREANDVNKEALYFNEFLIPAKKLCEQNISDTRAVNLKECIDYCIIAYNWNKKNFEFYRGYFINAARKLNQAKILMNNELKYFRNLSKKQ
jgi:hypothetical protein